MQHPPGTRDAFTGMFIAGAIALAATLVPAALAVLPEPLAGLPVSPILVAILLGLALAPAARAHPGWAPGLQFAAAPLLRLAVMLIGLRLSLAQVGVLGLQAIPMVVAALASGLGLAWLLGRLLGTGAKLTALLAVGSAICGASAIAATAPALRPRAEETAYALACVALFGLVATLIYPWLLNGWLHDGRLVGLVLGAAIQDTSQVTAAALLSEQTYGHAEVVAAATVTKLLRNLSMLVVIPAVVWWALRDEPRGPARPPFPLFIVGFLALAAVRSAGDVFVGEAAAWDAFLRVASLGSGFLFAMAMAAIGMGIRVQALKALGVKPAIVALTTALGMLACALLMIALVGGPA
ncbi:MAG: YeiH family protein [Gammaproteobacteria bacterium]